LVGLSLKCISFYDKSLAVRYKVGCRKQDVDSSGNTCLYTFHVNPRAPLVSTSGTQFSPILAKIAFLVWVSRHGMYVGYLSLRGGAPAGIEKVGVKIEVDHCFIPTHFGHIFRFPALGMNTVDLRGTPEQAPE